MLETHPKPMKSESLGPGMSLYMYWAQALQVFLIAARAENHSFLQRDNAYFKYLLGCR